MIDQLHFLRPGWLLAFIPLVLLLIWLQRNTRVKGAWQAICDPHLIPYVLEGGAKVRRTRNTIVMGIAGALAILALAGPAWQRLPQPVFEQHSALVVMLDLSKSMEASDITPSRLTRARLKLLDLLQLRKEGQTALIVYAGDAFAVTPLTDDTDTIAALVQSLSTTIMPSQGSRPDRAIQKALELLTQAGVRAGSLLLITDEVKSRDVESLAGMVVDAGHRLSIIGVGTSEGAPIPDDRGGFIKDLAGQIVVPKLDQVPLQRLARQTGGVYRSMQIDDSDLAPVLSLSSLNPLEADNEKTELQTDRWREEGPWLLLLLLPIATLVFRRGLLVVVMGLGLHWSDSAIAVGWDDIWLNSNQKGIQAMDREDYNGAAQQFTDDQWRAAAYYRAGNYEKALTSLEGIDTPESNYNRGNALARLGRIQDAIESYQHTLQQQPDHEDAKYNLELLKELLDQKNQQNQQDQLNKPSQSNQQQDDAEEGQKQQQSGQTNQGGSSQEQGQDESQGQSQSSRQQSNQGHTSDPAPPPGQQNAGPNDQTQQHQQDARQQEAEAKGSQRPSPVDPDQQKQTEQQQAAEQWLRRIPDDPGGLLRRKFRYQYSQRNQRPEQGGQQW
ncbi:MAG: VWA domain-containing protein [Arenicellales bacterium]|nr:VWA domain-containing protein [Arenicellales bacterium]